MAAVLPTSAAVMMLATIDNAATDNVSSIVLPAVTEEAAADNTVGR